MRGSEVPAAQNSPATINIDINKRPTSTKEAMRIASARASNRSRGASQESKPEDEFKIPNLTNMNVHKSPA